MSGGAGTKAPATGPLWLIRHGPTHAKTFVGWTDLPADLTDTGKIARLEAALPQAPVISSDLSRAVETASAIQGARPRLPHDPRWRETHFGDWEGLSWQEISARDGARARRVFETPGDHAPPGGESWDRFSARVTAAAEAQTGTRIVVAHMGVILALLQKGLGCSAYDALSHEIAPLSLTVIERVGDWRAGGWHVRQINQEF